MKASSMGIAERIRNLAGREAGEGSLLSPCFVQAVAKYKFNSHLLFLTVFKGDKSQDIELLKAEFIYEQTSVDTAIFTLTKGVAKALGVEEFALTDEELTAARRAVAEFNAVAWKREPEGAVEKIGGITI